jgi:hypothetical protein
VANSTATNEYLDETEPSYKDSPKSGTQEYRVHEWAMGLIKEGRMRRRHWEGLWWENIALYMGDFWVEWDIHRKRLVEPVHKPDHRVRMAVNLAQPAIRTELAKLLKNRPIMDVLARSSDQEDLNAAKVGDKMLNIYVEKKFKMQRIRKRMLNWALMCGRGGILVDWDKTALGEIEVFHNEEGNPVFDPRLIEEYKAKYKQEGKRGTYKKIPQGEMVIKPVSPFQILWDFSTNEFDQANWCIYSEVYDVEEVYRRWKVHVIPEQNVLPGIIENRLMGRMDLTGQLKERPIHAQKLCEVHQFWVKPGHPKFPDGLCLVFTKSVVIEETEYEYGHGELPVNMMCHIDLPTTQQGMSVLQQLRGPVLELSKTKSQLIENRNLMANPPWEIPRQLQVSKEIQNKPGLRLEYNFMPNVPPPKPIQMPEMPKYVTELTENLKEDIREISGQGETSQGKVPPGARSGVAIAYLQEEDDTRLGTTVQELEEVMESVAFQQLRMMAEKYDTPRLISIRGVNKQAEVFDFVGSMLAGAHGVECQSGSALPRSKAAKQQYILDLWDRKLEQDPRKVRQMLELSEGEPDEWEVDLDQAERENHELKEGKDPGVLEWYNHPAHHYEHRNYMKSAEFRTQPEEVKELFMKHDEEHTQMEQHQAAEMAANQAAMGGGGQQQGEGGGGPPPAGSSAPAGANGQTQVQGPPSQFTSASSPRTLMEGAPQ